VFQFLKTIRFLKTSRANQIAHQLVVATGMTPFYQIFSYHAGYIETGTVVICFS
jgi:precorrin isomerase